MMVSKSGITPSKGGLLFLCVIVWMIWRYSRVQIVVNPLLGPIVEFRESIVSQSRSQGGVVSKVVSSDWQRHQDDLQFTNLITRIAFPRIDGLDKYFAYDAGAKQALFDLTNLLHEQNASIPLFPDRFAKVDLTALPNPKLCVGIVTARRQTGPISYLVQTVTSLLTRMDLDQHGRDDLYMHVFNVDRSPQAHGEVNLIRHLLPVSNLKYASGFPNVAPKIQEGLDWVESMRELRRVGCKYPLMVEDDVVADEKWLEHVLRGIDQIEKSGDSTEWLMLKFYTARHRYASTPLRGVTDYNQGFNTVALVIDPERVDHFAQAVVEYTLSYLTRGAPVEEFVFIDLYIEEYSRLHRLSVKSYEPVAFQHAGIYSAVSARSLDHRGTHLWYMNSRYFQSEGRMISLDSTRLHVL